MLGREIREAFALPSAIAFTAVGGSDLVRIMSNTEANHAHSRPRNFCKVVVEAASMLLPDLLRKICRNGVARSQHGAKPLRFLVDFDVLQHQEIDELGLGDGAAIRDPSKHLQHKSKANIPGA